MSSLFDRALAWRRFTFWKPFLSRLPHVLAPELVASCIYIAGFSLPLQRNIILIMLAVLSVLASIFSFRNQYIRTPLFVPVIVFLAATLFSIVVSADVGRSIRLSAPFLPGILLFLVICQFRSIQQTRTLYAVFSIVALGLSCTLLWTALTSGGTSPRSWIAYHRSPIFVVVNDITFVAVTVPLSLALLVRSRGLFRTVPAVSILATIGAVCVYQSRAAILSLFISILAAVVLLRPRFIVVCGFIILGSVLIIDGLLGFPCIGKFSHGTNGRIGFLLVALSMFIDAPFIGHGLHTFGLFYKSYSGVIDLPPWVGLDPRPLSWAHNLYAQVLAEQGIVGMAALSFLLVSTLVTAWKIRESEVSEIRLLAIGAFAALVGFCAGCMFDSSFMREWVVVVLFTITAIISNLSSLSDYNSSQI
jgi:O-antigen ligase